MLDFIVLVIICYVLYMARGHIYDGAKWLTVKVVLVCKLPVVLVKCALSAVVAKEVQKQLWAKEAEEYVKRNS